MTQQDLGVILYKYYLDNYLENDFSFDGGTLRNKIESRYNKLVEQNPEEVEQIENDIDVAEKDGTDYEYMEISHPSNSNLIVQVTAMIDYDGNSCSDKYKDSDLWADVAMFMIDYTEVEFDDLEDK